MRAFAISVVAGVLCVVGCRPAVEDEIPCAALGDLACPTGYHCGDAQLCVAGEVAPSLTFETPATGAALTGRVDVRIRASSPRGLLDWGLRLEARTGGDKLTGDVTAIFESEVTRLSGTLSASFETWRLADGEYDLVATATSASGSQDPGTTKLPVTIANGVPTLAQYDPCCNLDVRGAEVIARAYFTSRLGLQSVFASVTGEGGQPQSPAAIPDWEAPATPLSGSATLTFDATAFEDGPATISVTVLDLAQRASTFTWMVNIANGAPTVTLESPAAQTLHKGTVAVHARLMALVPITSVTASATSLPGSATTKSYVPSLTWDNEAHTSGTAEFEVDTTKFPSSEVRVTVVAQNVAKASGQGTVQFEIDNSVLEIVSASATVSSRSQDGIATVVVSRPIPFAPTLETAAFDVEPAQRQADNVTYVYQLHMKSNVASDQVGVVRALDRFNVEATKPITFPVDVAGPGLVGDLHLFGYLTKPRELQFTCSESAMYSIKVAYISAPFTGTCSTSQMRVPIDITQQDVNLTLSDASGNANNFSVNVVTEELQVAGSAGTIRLAGNQLLQVPPFNGSNPGDESSKFNARDGSMASANANTTSAGAMASNVRGPLRQSHTRPIVFDEGSTALRFATIGQQYQSSLLTLWEMQGATGTALPLGSMPVNAVVRPAWDPNRRRWILRSNSFSNSLVATSPSMSFETPIGVPSEFVGQNIEEAIVCGQRYVGVRRNYDATTMSGGIQTLLVSMSPDQAGSSGVFLVGNFGELRLTCDGDAAVLITQQELSWLFYRLASTSSTWQAITQQGPLPPLGTEFMVSNDGLFGGGKSGTAMTMPETFVGGLFRITGDTITQINEAGSGPMRANGMLVTRGETISVVGGRGQTNVGLVASSPNFSEAYPPAPIRPYFNSGGVAFDYVRDALVGLEQGSAAYVHEWSPALGWKPRKEAREYDGHYNTAVAFVAGTVNKTFIGGGYNSLNSVATSAAHHWNGTTLQAVSMTSPFSASSAAALLNGSIVFGGDQSPYGPLSLARTTTNSTYNLESISPAFSRDAFIPLPRPWSQKTAGVVREYPKVRYVELRESANYLFEDRTVDVYSPGASYFDVIGMLPWRDTLVIKPTTGMMGGTELFALNTGMTDTSFSLPYQGLGTVFALPPPARRAYVLINDATYDSPLVEINDEPRASFSINLPYRNPTEIAAYTLRICGRNRQETATNPLENRILVDVITPDGIKRLPAGQSTPNCEAYTYTYDNTVADKLRVVVTSPRPALEPGVETYLDLDELVVTRTARIN